MLEGEALQVEPELAPMHRTFTQSALHPLLLRAPFVFRTYTKPLGYAGTTRWSTSCCPIRARGRAPISRSSTPPSCSRRWRPHNRIELLIEYLNGMAEKARAAGRPFRLLNVGCGPAVEIQRFIETYPNPELLSFQLVDFSEETLAYTREAHRRRRRTCRRARAGRVRAPVGARSAEAAHRAGPQPAGVRRRLHCAGLFDYLSDKVCSRLISYFASRTYEGGSVLATNVHASNPEKFSMEHMLEWYLIYRDEANMLSLLPPNCQDPKVYCDSTGVNVFVQATVHHPSA